MWRMIDKTILLHFYMEFLLHSEQLRCVLMVLPGPQLHHDISPHWTEQAHASHGIKA